jgi:D-alanine transaminase
MIKASTVYLNGQFISNDKAAISPNDRGFYFGDGIYEVIKFYRNKPFCFEEHMERLRNNLAEVRIDYNETDKFFQVCLALLEANRLKDKYAGVYIQITRGESSRTHRFPSGAVKPTVFARAFAMQSCLSEMIDGVMATTHEDIRWLRCNIKSIGLLPNTLLFEEAATRGAFECILVRNGYITEATHSNVLAVKDGTVCTHPDSNLILPGITKAAVLKICREQSLTVIEKPIRFEDILNYDEWFITGTGSEVVPVVNIDGNVIGNGKPGPVVKNIQQAFYKITYEDLGGETLPLRLK